VDTVLDSRAVAPTLQIGNMPIRNPAPCWPGGRLRLGIPGIGAIVPQEVCAGQRFGNVKLAATRWVGERVFIQDCPGFSDHTAYQAMDFLLDALDKIAAEVFSSVAHPDDHSEGGGQRRRDEQHPAAVEHPGQDIAAERVPAQEECYARCFEAL
jgi:hypothetical protein